jgi:sulfur carrier protein
MQIIVNGQRRESAALSLAELWREETEDAGTAAPPENGAAQGVRGYAIALNGAVVRRDAWGTTPVVDGDHVEIVRAMQGG